MKTKIFIGLVVVLVIFLITFFSITTYSYLYPLKYKADIMEYAEEYGVRPELVASIINAESRFDATAVSKKGAMGLMQIMPATAEWIAGELEVEDFKSEDLFEPRVNIRFGTYYLSYLMTKFEGEYEVICAYNAGESTVRAWLKDSSYSSDGVKLEKVAYSETNSYANKVLKNLSRYSKAFDK